MAIKRPSQPVAGFSLIEVLISLVVLATGMLALAALQSSMVRNSVDAKNRSFAQAMGVSKLERLRQEVSASGRRYEALDLGLKGPFPIGQRLQVNPSAANAGELDLPIAETGAAGEFAPGSSTANAAADYTWEVNVTRFVRERNQALCGGDPDLTPCFRSNTDPADPNFSPPTTGAAEFKRVDLTVRWTDATGAQRSATTSDIVGTVTDDKTSSILDQLGKSSTGVGRPIVQIPKPAEAGIIPIAIGEGKETAASNPKPVTGRERGRTDETQFQVLTYALDGGVATLNRLVDTRVIGCRCSLKAAGDSAVVDETTLLKIPVQATFWDGSFYREPEAVADITEGLRGVPQDDAVQSSLCQTCCLDHHDRDSNKVRFDPLRQTEPGKEEAPHLHYNDPDEADDLFAFKEAGDGDNYFEVCRMVRVNGTFRASTDMYLEQMNLLETDPAVTTESAPLGTKIPRYQEMVKEYVNQRVIRGAAKDQVDLSGFSDVLVDPAVIDLESDAERFLHNRGLYLDFLEDDAKKALAEAIDPDNCLKSDGTADDPINCALRVLPVVAINATPIAQWTSSNAVDPDPVNHHLVVTNWGLRPDCPKNDPFCSPPPPNRGLARAISGGTEDGLARMQVSNSGVSDSLPIDPQDANWVTITPPPDPSTPAEILSDAQSVLIKDACLSLGSFNVTLAGSNFTIPETLQQFIWRNPLADPAACSIQRQGVCPGSTSGGTRPNPFSCATGFVLPPSPSSEDVELFLEGYNRIIPSDSTPAGQKINNPCANGPKKVGQNICQNWAVDTVTVPDASGPSSAETGITYTNEGFYTHDAGTPGEGAIIQLKHAALKQGVNVTVTFALEKETPMGVTCDVNNDPVFTPCP